MGQQQVLVEPTEPKELLLQEQAKLQERPLVSLELSKQVPKELLQ